jgi:tRNA nucleotidyltransferase/poly(A) polymerase
MGNDNASHSSSSEGQDNDGSADEIQHYAGRWVAKIGDEIVGQGGTPEQAIGLAKTARFKESPQVEYIPSQVPLAFTQILNRVRAALPKDQQAYLVGGAVRDALMGRPIKDLDFVVQDRAINVARGVANRLGGAFYPLDVEHDTGRVILSLANAEKFILDFSVQRGPDLSSDLLSRDFTINAIAVDVHDPQVTYDPLGGVVDLKDKIIRSCTSTSIQEDPLRILRGIRLAAMGDFHIQPTTVELMRAGISGLETVSNERIRDEFFHILTERIPQTSLRALEMLGVIEQLFPELQLLKGVTQSAPHFEDVWAHTLRVIDRLGMIVALLSPQHDEELASSYSGGMVALKLGRFRNQINQHLNSQIVPDRSLRSLLWMSALYHDVGKPFTRTVAVDGRIRFIGHERCSAELVSERAREFRLSRRENDRLVVVAKNHLRPILLAQTSKMPTKKAVYRFFRDTGVAGVDVCLLALADTWATFGPALSEDVWSHQLDVVKILLEAWWERAEDSIAPPVLVNGHDLIERLGLEPGPQIGQLLVEIREAQVVGEIKTKEDAITFAQSRLKV